MTRRRTLIVTSRDDFFIPKLLDSILGPAQPPLPIDVLRFGPSTTPDSPQAFAGQVAMPGWPPGVREFSAASLHHAVAPTGQSLDGLLDGYDRVAVYSVHPDNADLILHVRARHPHVAFSVICSDDEIERHWNYQRLARQQPEQDALWRQRCLYPDAVQRAFEATPRFFIGRQPWAAMLRTGRTAPLSVVGWVPPIVNRVADFVAPARADHVYRLVLFPKPSVRQDAFLEAARQIARAHRAAPLEMVSFRNDMPTLSNIDGLWLRCHPYPLDEVAYHRAIAGSHGLAIVPRGGLSTIRDAVRYGLDLVSFDADSPNALTLGEDIGIELAPLHALSLTAHAARAPQRAANQARLARYEADAVRAFCREYLDPSEPPSPLETP